jgi:mannose-1-phosphate guanylyltransferase
MERDRPGNLWAIVLAAGEGSRMASLTRALYGDDRPKQFAALDSDRTLIQVTMDRIGRLIPASRTVVVVADAYEGMARAQLAGFPGVEIVTQPANLGTGPGILLPLAHVLARDPEAQVAVFPSDHHIRRPGPFVEAVQRAARVSSSLDGAVALLGATPDRPAADLGWIVRGAAVSGHLGRAWRVQRFVEKPRQRVADLLLRTGSLWNTMVLVGAGQALWQLARQHITPQTALFDRYLGQVGVGQGDARQARVQLYRQLAPADFSRDILQEADGLITLPLADAGWLDCGTPERLFDLLRGRSELKPLLDRLHAAMARAGARKPAAVSQSAVA